MSTNPGPSLIAGIDLSQIDAEAGPFTREALRRLMLLVATPSPIPRSVDLATRRAVRVLYSPNGTTQNTGAGDNDLFSQDIPAGTFSINGDAIHVWVDGRWAANGATKAVTITFNGTTLLALGPATVNGGSWWAEIRIKRSNSTTGSAKTLFNTNNSAGTIITSSDTQVFPVSVDWTLPLTLKVTVNGDATGDILLDDVTVLTIPSPNH